MSELISRPVAAARAQRRTSLRDLLEREHALGYLLIAPALILMAIFLAYPFVSGILFSLRDDRLGSAGDFVGLSNYVRLLTRDDIFIQTLRNTVVYTFWATVLKVGLGLALALLLNQAFRGRKVVRAALLLPYIVPTALSALAWLWMLHSTHSVINWTLKASGLIQQNLPFLADSTLALASLIGINAWRGIPFFAIGLLAGLQSIAPELYEAAAIDGAGLRRRFWHITLPLVMPVLLIIILFSIIQTFADFQLIFVLTRGGPANSTHVLSTYAYQVGMIGGELSMGAAISLFMFPIMLLLTIAVLWHQRRETA